MIRHKCLTLLFSLAVCATMAQPATDLNTIVHADNSGTNPKAPRKPKAVESPFYIKAYGFYGLLTPGSQVGSSVSSSGSVTSFKTNSTGLGAGLRAGVGIGTILSDFINVGIDADMLFGTDIKTDYTYKGSNYTYTSNSLTTLRVLSIIPNVTFKALSRPSYYIYNRLGLVGGIVLDYKLVQTSLNVPTAGASSTGDTQNNYADNSLAIGYQAALGIQFRLSQSLRGFAEIVAYNQSFKPKELRRSYSETKGGVVTKTNSITEYKDQGDYTTTKKDGIDVNQSPSINVAMNSVGVGAGLLFRF
ncbi:hypothetical protein [Spirosoma areae]